MERGSPGNSKQMINNENFYRAEASVLAVRKVSFPFHFTLACEVVATSKFYFWLLKQKKLFVETWIC